MGFVVLAYFDHTDKSPYLNICFCIIVMINFNTTKSIHRQPYMLLENNYRRSCDDVQES